MPVVPVVAEPVVDPVLVVPPVVDDDVFEPVVPVVIPLEVTVPPPVVAVLPVEATLPVVTELPVVAPAVPLAVPLALLLPALLPAVPVEPSAEVFDELLPVLSAPSVPSELWVALEAALHPQIHTGAATVASKDMPRFMSPLVAWGTVYGTAKSQNIANLSPLHFCNAQKPKAPAAFPRAEAFELRRHTAPHLGAP
jgi:hypothetical protein